MCYFFLVLLNIDSPDGAFSHDEPGDNAALMDQADGGTIYVYLGPHHKLISNMHIIGLIAPAQSEPA